MKILIFPADQKKNLSAKFPQNGIFLYLPKGYFLNLLFPFQTLKKKSFPLPFLSFNLLPPLINS